MTDPYVPNDNDRALLHELRDVYVAADPAPADLTAKALAGIAVDDLDTEYELLQLLETRGDLAGARAAEAEPGTVTLQFASNGVDVLLRVSRLEDAKRRLDGWVAPAGASDAILRGEADEWRTAIDPAGRFEFASLPHGPVRLWLTGGENDFSTTMFEL